MSNNKQQTAVEFYIEKLADILDDDIVNKLTIEQTNNISFLTKKAKEMEKQQIIIAYNKAVPFKFGEQYYKETYED